MQQRIGVPVHAVRGNVDDAPDTTLPTELRLSINGWRLFVTHVVGMPPRVSPDAAARVRDADIVVFGHSHKPGQVRDKGAWYVNPGAAGPARFKLPRTAAVLTLPPKHCKEGTPALSFVTLRPRAPPRLTKTQTQ